MNWENISGNHSNSLYRTRVPFGWLVMSTDEVLSPRNSGYSMPEYTNGYEWRTSITYVFDPFKMWKIKDATH